MKKSAYAFLVPEQPWQGVETRHIPIGDKLILGRDKDQVEGVAFDDDTIAMRHASIRRNEEGYWLYDEGSAGGTYLNYERLGLTPRYLREGDVIQLGRIRLRFQMEREE